MNIAVEYINTHGVLANQMHRMSRVAFAKHLAIAGQGYAPTPRKLIRTIAMFLHYSYYTRSGAFNDDRFSEPPIELSDPTEKGQFSNLAGRAIADFLSKHIGHSMFTVNYEAAMRLRGMRLSIGRRQVRRPDLLAFANNETFAVEAKGFSGGYGNMGDHKAQSQTGGIPVNYTIASVAYDLYRNVKCKYHDPFNDNVAFDNELLGGLTRDYYAGLAQFLNEKFFYFREAEYFGEQFYEVDLSNRNFFQYFKKDFPFSFWQHELLDYYRPTLILPRDIRAFAKNGISNNIRPFLFDSIEQNSNIYIDNDRVGLSFRR
ncbi:hypothetical protein [Mucilaginibacter boryungensis]|uniref:Restriction endonuclease n=1 Tax=Mucilaginibacter boryungensis TaxID=768480 RepID=A0ABR9XEQ8_9SPHI|nr:hypothetical protein [Mucilaginibacter boryungensis]MBE9665685.1 hypothetical protein [Mucilaginibacter boryungensis]